MPKISRPLPYFLCILLSWLVASPALACGGFFCSQVLVDQTRERILFETNGNGTTTMTIEISYTGDSESFSWIVPVPDLSEDLSGVTPSALMLLDGATSPQIIPPGMTGWDDFATGDDDDDDLAGEDSSGGAPNDGGVLVEDLPRVGPFEPELISSDDASALTTWLNENDYLITDEMFVYVQRYVEDGMKFLGMKMAPDAGVTDISPIQITYPGEDPMVPIVLTSVSAEPEMGFAIFIASNQRYESSNFANLEVDTSLLQADPRTGEDNYYPLLSWQADAYGGRAFFTEYADTTANLQNQVNGVWLASDDWEEAQSFVTDITESYDYVTRLYTRMSNWEMVEADPLFAPSVETATVARTHDLSDREPVHWDMSVAPRLSCNTTYCGQDAQCAATEAGVDGCICEPGFTARAILAPTASAMGNIQSVACQDASFDLMASIIDDLGELGMTDPCDTHICGEGTCINMNGSPTCECNEGYAAVNIGNSVTCSAVNQTFTVSQLLWPNWPPEVDSSGDDDDASGDDDDGNGDGSSSSGNRDFSGLDGRVACACTSSIANADASSWVLAVALVLGLTVRRKSWRS